MERAARGSYRTYEYPYGFAGSHLAFTPGSAAAQAAQHSQTTQRAFASFDYSAADPVRYGTGAGAGASAGAGSL